MYDLTNKKFLKMQFKVRLLSIFLFLIGTAPVQLFSQTAKGFIITGHLNGLEDGIVVKLYHRTGVDWHLPIFMDSCVASNGDFHLKGVDFVSEEPRPYLI